MATVRFTGAALPEADIKTITVSGTWATSDTATLTINGRDLVLTVGTDTTTANIATAIKEMWNGDTQTGTGDHTFSETGDNVGEFSEMTATVSGSVVTLTGNTKGVPITVTETVSTAGTGDLVIATTNAGTGPNSYNNADNWSGGAVPTSGVNEVVVVDLASGTASGGTFTITFGGNTTSALAYNASASTVQTALEALASIGAGNILVAGTDINSGYTLTFTNDLMAQDVGTVTMDDGSLTGSSPVGQVTVSQAGSAGDDVIFDLDIPLFYDLDQSAVLLNSITLAGVFGRSTGRIGLPDTNQTGNYSEYREKYLKISAKTITIDSNSSRIKLNTGSYKTTLNINGTGSRDRDGLAAVLFTGTSAYNVLNVRGRSSLGIAVLGGETAGLADLNITGSSEVECGTGVTFAAGTTVDMNGRSLLINSSLATLDHQAGTVTVEAGALTTLTQIGGRCIYNSTSALGTATLSLSAILDFSQDPRVKTVTNPIDLYGQSCFVIDPEQTVSSLVVDLNQGARSSQVNRGQNYRVTYGATA